MIPFMWSAGSILGAAMGGYLARPADTWPSLFPKSSIFTRYPYLLPNFVAAAYIVFAILLGTAFLKETNLQSRPLLFARLDVAEERTPLLSNETASNEREEHQKARERRSSLVGMPPLTTGTTVDIRRRSVSTTTDSIKPAISAGDRQFAIDEAVEDEEDEVPKHGYSRAMILFIIQLFLMSYHQMGFGSLTPVFLLDVPSDNATSRSTLDLHGGLGYTVRDVGGFMAVNGAVALVIQAIIIPPFINKAGVWKSFLWMTIICPIVYVFVPFLTAIQRPQLQIGVYAALILQAFTLLIIYPCLLILLKNATPSMSMLGSVNGLAQTGCSGARTVAPPIAGFVYSKAGSAAAWWSVGAVALIAAISLFVMKPPPPDPAEEHVSSR